ncbi:hypothetical protein [Marinobacter sp. EN3]|uniref:hypothetical protein n=1 Tax=Marinobacter sp. EN3 TaxID=1397533 RepID=UPI00126884F1|nr:hypothetical protein [Marinobacter sp. EN3]
MDYEVAGLGNDAKQKATTEFAAKAHAPNHQKTAKALAFNANIQRRPFCSAAEKRASGGGPSGPERTGMTG